MSKEKKKSTLVEQHALKRLEKVEENQRKAYEKKKMIFLETNNYGIAIWSNFALDVNSNDS